jgi:hypothetical protein
MKRFKKFWIFLFFLIVIITTIIIYSLYKKSEFPKKELIYYTGIKEFVTRYKYSDNHQIYIEVAISAEDKQMLLSKFKFENNLQILKGKAPCPFIIENPGFIYYYVKNDYGPYGYVLLALEKNSNKLQFFEIYGD